MRHARLLLIAALALPGAVAAQTPAPPAFQPLVGGSDFISPVGEPFHSADALSGAEHWFAGADTNHDGRLTVAEMRADALRFFATLDVDHDGQIDPNEIERYETVVAPEIQVTSTVSYAPESDESSDSEPSAPPYPDRLGAGRFGYIALPEPIISMDTNFDRAISQAEFVHAAEVRFRQLDTDMNGAITRDELPKLKSSAGTERKEKRHKKR